MLIGIRLGGVHEDSRMPTRQISRVSHWQTSSHCGDEANVEVISRTFSPAFSHGAAVHGARLCLEVSARMSPRTRSSWEARRKLQPQKRNEKNRQHFFENICFENHASGALLHIPCLLLLTCQKPEIRTCFCEPILMLPMYSNLKDDTWAQTVSPSPHR